MHNPAILVVDEDDNPIGSMDVSKAHKQGVIHRIARIMIEDGKGNLLLQKRASRMKWWPDCWDNSVAGHVDEGEEYLQAAVREMKEELGIVSKGLEEMGTYFTDEKYTGHHLRRFNRAYKLSLSQTPKNFDPNEVSEVKWVSIEDTKKLIHDHPEQVTDGLKDVLERYY